MEKSIQETIKAERAAYMREWRRKHPQQQKAIEERYWLRKAEERKAREGANA